VASPSALAAWVAVAGEEDDADVVVGHVCLNPSGSPEVMTRAIEATGADAFGVVARLFVDPAHRRTGIGEALLATAAAEARRRGLLPILDVATSFARAIALYERTGWQCLGHVRVEVGGGHPPFEELVYALP
jgi:GNAT superfamily N-acetyltransferase